MKQFLEITTPGYALSKDYGLCRITFRKEPIAAIPLDEIEAVIMVAQATVTTPLLVALAENHAPVLLCDEAYVPAAMVLPVTANAYQAERIEAQVKATTQFKARIWREIVRGKIRNQAWTLDRAGNKAAATALRRLAAKVRNADATNQEAVAARCYFPALFGPDFIRERTAEGMNALLNYGYTVLRAMLARKVVAAGLLPALALHHKSTRDNFRLVDDLIEPWRPYVDHAVWTHAQANPIPTLTPETRRSLIEAASRLKTTAESMVDAYIKSLLQADSDQFMV
jgi:CRISPR-associated protein Cas1